MERRFSFRFYDNFISLEKGAKESKKGIWSDADVSKDMNKLAKEEKELLELEQEKEYLLLQEELLRECQEEGKESCDTEISWASVTEKMSTLSVSLKKTGLAEISGRTWAKLPVRVEILQANEIVETFVLESNERGDYETVWIPREVGEYTIRSTFIKDSDEVKKEKQVIVEILSSHLTTSLTAKIILQGKMSKNRWQTEDVFHCRSRGSCSLNFIAETNRETNVNYFWIFPDGSLDDRKNPGAIKVGYGQYEVILIMSDDISDETVTQSIRIDHRPIPKKPKKPASSNYTLDLKDVPQDIGGGVAAAEDTPLQKLAMSLSILALLSGGAYFTMRKTSVE